MTLAARGLAWSAAGRMIVDGITLDVPEGATLGLLGPNGSGKSTLLRLLARLRKPSGGTVLIDGRDAAALPRRALARRLALVEQGAATDLAVTVEDVVRLGRTPHRGPFAPWSARDAEAVARALAATDMSEKRTQSWATLSGGERQRAQIARALAQAPRELLLDEPTNHLDVQHQLDLLRLVADLPLTSVIALHDMNLAALFCDRLIVLANGRVAAAGPPETVLTEDLVRAVFKVRAVIARSPVHGRLHVQFIP